MSEKRRVFEKGDLVDVHFNKGLYDYGIDLETIRKMMSAGPHIVTEVFRKTKIINQSDIYSQGLNRLNIKATYKLKTNTYGRLYWPDYMLRAAPSIPEWEV